MAKVEILIDTNEYELFDYVLTINGVDVGTDENYTTLDGAHEGAMDAVREWVSKRESHDEAAV